MTGSVPNAAPNISSAAPHRPAAWRRLPPQLLPVLVLLVTMSITYWLWRAAQQDTFDDMQTRFDYRVREVAAALEQRMNTYEQVLRGVDGMYANVEGAGRKELVRYLEKLKLEENYPGIQGVGISLRVLPQQREQHTAAQRRTGLAKYAITPEGEREVYSPVIAIEPLPENGINTIGFDPYTVQISRTAMERSRDLDKPIISRMIKPSQEAGKDGQVGFIMYLPMYKPGHAHQSVSERRANIIGWAYAEFRMGRLLEGILGGRTDDISIRIHDGEIASRDTLMYDSGGGSTTAGAGGIRLTTTRYVEVGGHTWATEIRSLPGLEAQMDIGKPMMIARIGLGSGLLLAVLSWLFLHGRVRALQDAAKLAAAEASYQSMFENAQDAVFLLRDNIFIDCNPRAEILFGCKREQIIGEGPEGFSPQIQPDGSLSSDSVRKNVRLAYDGEQPFFEWLHLRDDGSSVYCDIALRRVMIGGEALILANVRDINDRKKAEDEIKRTSAQLEAILQNALVGICYVVDRRHQWMNSKFAEMMGFAPEELIGQQTLIHFPDEKSWIDIGKAAYPVIEQGKPFSADWQLKRKDGTVFWAQLFGKCVDPTDLSRGSIWTYLDISGRKQAEDEIKAALEKQKELNQLKSRFVAMTSHEFRTPLATIQSSAELLKYYSDKMPAEERQEVICSIEVAVKRMADMLENILVIGKVDAAKTEFQPAWAPLKPFCERLVREIQITADQAAQNKCRLSFQMLGDSGPRLFDERLLHYILGNLLSNAVKYSPNGGEIFFGVVCRPESTEFTVADQGIGMAQNDVAHLFETFYRASNVGNISGTGLGLAIVKRSVDLHGGSVKVDSILGTGTRFVVTLPIPPHRQSEAG